MNILNWQLSGIAFTLILGTLLHFTYGWSGSNPFIGAFSPVNESSWEHLKLIFTPMLLFTILEYFVYGSEIENFIPVKALSIALGMFVILAAFYTYTGIIGQNFLVLDIGTFILGTLSAYWFSNKLLSTSYLSSPEASLAGLILLLLMAICIVMFTYAPPAIQLFRDPITGRYGI